MSVMEVMFSPFGFMTLAQFFTIGLVWRSHSHTNSRLDALARELRSEMQTFASEVRSEFAQLREALRSVDRRLGSVEHRLDNVETRLGRLEQPSEVRV